MASIQSLGIGSGLLTSELVEDIIKAEREASDLRLDRREEKVEAQISAYGEIKAAISNLQSSASSLSDLNAIRRTSATSSNEQAVTATTNNQAETGNYTLRIDNVAEAHSLASQRYNAVTDTVGTGTLTFRFGGYEYNQDDDIVGFTPNTDGNEFEIELSSGNNTLTGIRDTINQADMGVRASLVNDGQGYRLLFTSEDTGEQNAMEITANGDSGLQSLAFNPGQNDPESNMSMTQKAMDANLSVNGLQITSATNELTEVARGTTINLHNATNGSTVNLNITRDPGAMVERVEAFLEAYNEFRELAKEFTAFDQGSGEAGLLLGDSALRQVENQVRRALTQIVEGLEDSQYRSLADIGIFTDRNNDFKLALNAEKLETAFRDNIDNFSGLLASKTQANDPLINYIAKGGDTKPGEYDIEITQVATQGRFDGQSVAAFDFAQDVVIGSSNDKFRLNIDGTAADVQLAHGNYSSGDDLALMIQNSINNTTSFQDRGRSVTVEFDAVEQSMNIVSSRYGSQSQVFFETMAPTVANTLGFTEPGQGGVSGQFYSNLSDQAFGATTTPGSREVFADNSFNFSSNPVTFDLDLTGTSADGTHTITLDEDMSSQLDNEGNVVEERTRDDMLSYINSELNAAGLSGVVRAEFNSGNRLVFSTEVDGGSQSIELSGVTTPGEDVLGLASAEGASSSGVTIAADTAFEISIENRYGVAESQSIEVPAGTYETPEELAQAIQTAINDDPNIQASASGAMTLPGSRPIENDINFDNRASGFEFEYNGQRLFVDVDEVATTDINGDGEITNLDSIQLALNNALDDAGLPANSVLARMESGGLVLETADTGSSEVLNVISDGRGDRTVPGAVITGGEDFAADPVGFTLRMDGVDIDVALDEDISGADADETLAYIQTRLDQALIAADGGGAFMAGDIKARLNDDGELYFESQSKMGEKTSATYGALAALEITDTNAAAENLLGLAEAGPQIDGRDEFGLPKGAVPGFDAQSVVSYEQDSKGRGSFNISFDNETRVTIESVTSSAAAQLGFGVSDGSESQVVTGKDVEGTINGTKAIGRGQVLEAGSGQEAATNGYILGSPGTDFSSAVVLDSTNNSFQVTVDDIASGDIELEEGVYTTGASLAAEMTRAINADPALMGAGKFVEVQYDPDTNIFGIFSTSTGEDSKVRLNDIDSNLSNVTGLTPNSETVDGKEATGEADPAKGITLRVLGGETGQRGTVNYIQGVFDQLKETFADMLSSRGTITTRLDRLDTQMEQIFEERVSLEQRMNAQEARLRAQFSFNDRIIAQLNNTESFLQQQFEIMNGMLANRN
ncbi:hypothetical protein E4656_02010 [Natronospirillum operosum]|uniref:Filament cap protein n=1 Tax=Natronospirillum operosum TaxID=2759953 RepID=A0A4Z0W9C5_9GAMM|nr:flagellar filament capping protein FliD [Natronospirillum operosum]TGG95219.1 hypothetical protein E4656_02010 [Natronospirillum operosum]